MIKIFVYAADQQLAEQTVQRLKEAGAGGRCAAGVSQNPGETAE